MAHLALDKNAEEFREAHAARQQVVAQWQDSMDLLARRDTGGSLPPRLLLSSLLLPLPPLTDSFFPPLPASSSLPLLSSCSSPPASSPPLSTTYSPPLPASPELETSAGEVERVRGLVTRREIDLQEQLNFLSNEANIHHKLS